MTVITTNCVGAAPPSEAAIPLQAAFALIPSQVTNARHPTTKKNERQKYAPVAIYARDGDANQYNILDDDHDDDAGGDVVVYKPPSATGSDESVASRTSADSKSEQRTPGKTRRGKVVLSRTGNLPDVYWRAIPLSHLRFHPNFQPLPPPSFIHHLPTKEHVRYFRQESWQWDYLHQGRCTTSQAAAALGFLEPNAATFLGIPRSLRRGGGGAWERLRQDTSGIYQLDEMERALCEDRTNGGEFVQHWKPGQKESERTWMRASRLWNQYPFPAKYIPTVTEEELLRKKEQVKSRMKNSMSSVTRMLWGNAQEATSILTALNYFCSQDKNTMIHEVGMCGAGFDDSDDSNMNGLKIGASPDAIIRHGNGTYEVLEVKNHCPFVWNRINPSHSIGHNRRSGGHKDKKKKQKHRKPEKDNREKNSNKAKLFCLRDFDLECKVPTVYIPQLMMEMLCVGSTVDLDNDTDNKSEPSTPICKSAIMVRQTATRGAILLRLYRDDHWLSEMKYFLGKFKKDYVDTGVIPPDDFFWDHDENGRYRQFLQKTKELSESVEKVAFIDHGRIQRIVMNKDAGYDTPPLFLDYVEGPTKD